MISVCMITYNHEKYIRQAVEGVLSQEVEYPFELNIFNDASTDRTGDIIRSIITLHPKGELIRYHVHEKNIGLPANYRWSINNCRGKYVAICEGDDYWIDRNKLQKQVDVLEQNPAYSFSFHQALRVDTVNNRFDIYPVNNKTEFDPASFFSMTTIPMASVVFRNDIPIHFEQGHMQLDFALLCNLLSHGNGFFLKEVMSVFRVHSSSFSYNRGAMPYMRKMIADIQEAARIKAYSPEVRKQVAGVYMRHVVYFIESHTAAIPLKERFRYCYRFLRIHKPSSVYWTYYSGLVKKLFRRAAA